MLQPITDGFPHYNDLSEANRGKHQREKNQWWQLFQSFQRLLKTAAGIAVERNELTFKQAHKYFSSGTGNNRIRIIYFTMDYVLPSRSYIPFLLTIFLYDIYKEPFSTIKSSFLVISRDPF